MIIVGVIAAALERSQLINCRIIQSCSIAFLVASHRSALYMATSVWDIPHWTFPLSDIPLVSEKNTIPIPDPNPDHNANPNLKSISLDLSSRRN